jgi:hypothetical protein
MNINELTIGQAKELANLLNNKTESNKSHPFEIGRNYLIRTVTMSHVGRLEAVYDDTLVLADASWVADTGRFNDAIKSGLDALNSSEIEPFVNNLIIGRGALIDMTIYNFSLPTKQK